MTLLTILDANLQTKNLYQRYMGFKKKTECLVIYILYLT